MRASSKKTFRGFHRIPNNFQRYFSHFCTAAFNTAFQPPQSPPVYYLRPSVSFSSKDSVASPKSRACGPSVGVYHLVVQLRGWHLRPSKSPTAFPTVRRVFAALPVASFAFKCRPDGGVTPRNQCRGMHRIVSRPNRTNSSSRHPAPSLATTTPGGRRLMAQCLWARPPWSV